MFRWSLCMFFQVVLFSCLFIVLFILILFIKAFLFWISVLMLLLYLTILPFLLGFFLTVLIVFRASMTLWLICCATALILCFPSFLSSFSVILWALVFRCALYDSMLLAVHSVLYASLCHHPCSRVPFLIFNCTVISLWSEPA